MKSFQEWLNEAPYLNTDGSFSMSKVKFGNGMSAEAIQRDYDLLNNALPQTSSRDYLVIMDKETKDAPVIRVVEAKQNKEGRHNVVGQLKFKKSPTNISGLRRVIQVDGIHFDSDIKNQGFATSIYRSLVRSGYTVVSDSTQFKPGAGIWKKLAREASNTGMTVRIYDDRTKEFISKNGKPVHYDGSNLKDEEIWTTGWDFDGEHILLVMT